MMVLGLTGSIAMGKSTIAAMFRAAGIAVHDADAAVHQLMQPDGAAFAAIADAFPEAISDGAIDRQALGQAVFGQPEARRRLEAILHPLVRAHRQNWLRQHDGAEIVVFDIPLLYETGSEQDCDAVVVVSTSSYQQRRRALARPGMTSAKLDAILSAQLDDAEKRLRADFIIPTCYGKTASRWHVSRILNQLATGRGTLNRGTLSNA